MGLGRFTTKNLGIVYDIMAFVSEFTGNNLVAYTSNPEFEFGKPPISFQHVVNHHLFMR